MKIRTIMNTDIEELDKDCNDFESKHNVKATQTQMVLLPNGEIMHKAVLFYLEDK